MATLEAQQAALSLQGKQQQAATAELAQRVASLEAQLIGSSGGCGGGSDGAAWRVPPLEREQSAGDAAAGAGAGGGGGSLLERTARVEELLERSAREAKRREVGPGQQAHVDRSDSDGRSRICGRRALRCTCKGCLWIQTAVHEQADRQDPGSAAAVRGELQPTCHLPDALILQEEVRSLLGGKLRRLETRVAEQLEGIRKDTKQVGGLVLHPAYTLETCAAQRVDHLASEACTCARWPATP